MSLSDELTNLTTAIHFNAKHSCKIQEFIESDTFTDEDRDAVNAVIANRSVFTPSIMAVLRKRGLRASDTSMNRHRRQACSCYINMSTDTEA